MITIIRMYLAGGMTGLSFKEQTEWRDEFTNGITDRRENERILVFNPVKAYNLEVKTHKTEREPFYYDIYNLKKSDIVIVNIDKQDSIGTCMEIAIAHDNGIPIVALHTNDAPIHPWIDMCCLRICDSMDELVDYIADYYLV